ncbi:hypothetical protein [Dictyobacter aurantiacus]|uniref:DUF4388 domain-containing protein n=1 Tax=Dictyobacter aurantiacus TaxID=1936993 RepID=A0A401ZPM4_9CHLR|nr:hypothetical protein [Dictyobacter aurantiacus]GCE08813.1 hypothetical protein KDAU_61420 [Dictyobacter aurantiacus]
MGKEHIDASLGLAFSLALFEKYRKNGLLHAEVHHVPGIRGRCKGFLHLVEGKVVACYIEDKEGRRHTSSSTILIKLDSERGPFEWMLSPHPAPPSLDPRTAIPARPIPNSPVPKTIAPLDLDGLEGWTSKQKLMLSIVYGLINGAANIEEIKSKSPLPPSVTEEALRVLLAMKLIVILV